MKTWLPIGLVCGMALGAGACGQAPSQSGPDAPQSPDLGAVRGRVRLTGTPPDNPAIRMRADPMCVKVNQGRQFVAELVLAGPDGGLANVFVQLQGSFPRTAPPDEPVLLDQRGCIYRPRVVGLQLGQTLRVGNSDPGLHNVHGVSTTIDEFNISQPFADMVNDIRPEQEGMLRLQCDVHSWMVAYVGVVSHPYFAVSDRDGTFEIRNVPPGSYTIQAWHERYGVRTASVQVEAGSTAEPEFTYAAEDGP